MPDAKEWRERRTRWGNNRQRNGEEVEIEEKGIGMGQDTMEFEGKWAHFLRAPRAAAMGG